MMRGTDKTNPVAVRDIANDLAELTRSLPEFWVEGQLAEVKIRPGMGISFLSLRDTESEISLQVACSPHLLRGLGNEDAEGQRVVLQARTEFWTKRGSLMLRASAIESVGIGDLLAKLAELQAQLREEGLFDPARKKSLPHVPNKVGLICGRASDAMHDVINNSRRRWPGVVFEVHEVAVQGVNAVREVSEALRKLDQDSSVDVIVIARGGGAFEDLLVFSDESLLRLAADTDTPLVSAIGHEEDSPLLDLIADARASTPTDAARQIVPDLSGELEMLDSLRDRAARIISELIEKAEADIEVLFQRSTTAMRGLVARESEWLAGARGQVRALSPLATLARGYSVIKADSGSIITSVDQIEAGQDLFARLSDGEIAIVVK